MARVTRETAARGEIFAVERLDYRVTCAGENCCCEALISWDNQCWTIGQARRRAARDKHKPMLEISGWGTLGGLWYCPTCYDDRQAG